MQIRVLGPVAVTRSDGTTFQPPSEGQRKLLALLAIRAGRSVAAETMCDLFAITPGAVRTTVSRLRKALGDVLVTERSGYALRCDTDIAQFQALVTSARTAGVELAEQLRIEALELFAEPALAEFSDQPWAVAEVARLHELRSSVVEDLASGYIDDARHDDALHLLHRHLSEHPYRDRPHELQMQALALSGRQVEALRSFQDYRSRLGAEVGVEPAPALYELDKLIAAGELTGRNPPGPGSGADAGLAESVPDRSLSNLQVPVNDFIGREREIAEIGQAVADYRLITLLGPGGVGKTRLAYRVAADQIEAFGDGVWVAELVGCEDGEDVLRTVASVFGISGVGTIDALAAQLAGHHLLLVLDNCEHLSESIGAVVDELLSRTARLRLLATSRVRLGVVGERTISIAPLRTDGEAQSLFVSRAAASGSEFSDRDMDAVGAICRRLDGIPLALELAAASTRVLGPLEILDRLDDRFAILKGGPRGAVAGRHVSLRAAVDSSYESLSPAVQQFFRRIAVFAGDFPLEAAEAASVGLGVPAVDLLVELVDRSLVTVQSELGRSRYRLLETLRHYGQDRLRELDEYGAAVEIQIDWCFEFSKKLANNSFGSSEIASLAKLVAISPNLRLAVTRLIDRGEIDRATDLVLHLADHAYASNTLASLVAPIVEAGASPDHRGFRQVLAMELIRRATDGVTDTRAELASRLAEGLRHDDAGTIHLPVLLIGTALNHGQNADFIDRVVARAEKHTSTAERARLLCAAGLGVFYGDELPEDLDLAKAAMVAAQRAGMKRLTVAAASMACIGGLRLGTPLDGATIAGPVLSELAELGEASIMSSGLIAMYTEAAILGGLDAKGHLAAVKLVGPNLRGDFNRIGLALARVVQHHGHSAMAVRAIGACAADNRSAFSSNQRAKILTIAQQDLTSQEIDRLLATGAVSETTDLYREMWAVISPGM